MTTELDGRVAIVTGGSRGIGRAVAAAIIGRGARVAITGRSETNLAGACDALGGGERLSAVACDVRNPDDVRLMVESTVERFGRLDILVNNAGIGMFSNVADLSPSDWQAVLETNASGVFYCCHYAIPHLRRAHGGWIINISSLAGKNPFVGGGAYCASKAALNAFSEALMQEVRYDDIRVSYVMPGSVATEFTHPVADESPDWRLTPDDVARTVLDLIDHPSRSLPSRVELRPSKPKRK